MAKFKNWDEVLEILTGWGGDDEYDIPALRYEVERVIVKAVKDEFEDYVSDMFGGVDGIQQSASGCLVIPEFSVRVEVEELGDKEEYYWKVIERLIKNRKKQE